jgi:flagellar hook-length control protein FliK
MLKEYNNSTDLDAVKEFLGAVDTLLVTVADENEIFPLTGFENLKTQVSGRSAASFLRDLRGVLQHLDNSFSDKHTISILGPGGEIEHRDVSPNIWEKMSQIMEMTKYDESRQTELQLPITQTEMQERSAIRDLQNNIAALLQKRQSLQDLFTSDAIKNNPEMKEFPAKLLTADKRQGEKKDFFLTQQTSQSQGETKDFFLTQQTSQSIKPKFQQAAVLKLMDTLQKWDAMTRHMGAKISVSKVEQQVAFDQTSGLKEINFVEKSHSLPLPQPESLHSAEVIVPEASSENVDEFGIERVHPVRLIYRVADKMRLGLKKGTTTLKIELEPPSLGRLQIELSVKDNQMRALLIVETPQAKQILESNLNQLRTALESQQIEIEKFSVSLGNEHTSFASYLKEDQGPALGRQLPDNENEESTETAEVNQSASIQNEMQSTIVDLFV